MRAEQNGMQRRASALTGARGAASNAVAHRTTVGRLTPKNFAIEG
jgi:hypothetical protein